MVKLSGNFAFQRERNSLKIYNTLVLWYFGKKDLRPCPDKRKFLIRSQKFVRRGSVLCVGESDSSPSAGTLLVKIPVKSYFSCFLMTIYLSKGETVLSI